MVASLMEKVCGTICRARPTNLSVNIILTNPILYLYSKGMHPVARAIKLQDKTLARNS
jgi:hypothetical protein